MKDKTATLNVNQEQVAITFSFENSSWWYVIRYAVGWWLIPILVIVSKLIKKRINF